MVKEPTWLRAPDMTIRLVQDRKGVMTEHIQRMRTGGVMEGTGIVVAGEENTAMIMVVRIETHVTNPDRMHSIAVSTGAGARTTGTLPIGIAKLKAQGMQVNTTAEKGTIIIDTEKPSLTLIILSAIA